MTSQFQIRKYGSIAIILSMATFIFDAPIRYALSLARLESLLYLRDLTCGLIVAASITSWITGKSKTNLLLPTYIILLHFFWGLINLSSIAQPVVALKIYITFLAGLSCYHTYENNEKSVNELLIAFYFLTAIGVVIDYFFSMPWAGATFNSAVGEVSVSREWTSGGFHRVSGFGRASSETAAFLALLGAPLIVRKNLPTILTAAFFFFNLVLISLTTTKGGILAWIIIGILTPAIKGRPNQNITIVVCLVLAGVGLAIPTLIYLYEIKLDLYSELWWLLSSFADRVNRMWPEALSNVANHGNLILGRGLGGIGFPQLFGEGRIYNSADNVMLYIYVSFGAPGILYVLILLRRLLKAGTNAAENISPVFSIWLIYWFTYGLVGNNIDSAAMLFSAGLIAGAALKTNSPNK